MKLKKAVAGLCLALAGAAGLNADEYHAKPKLVIVLVYDQMRGDYLDRFRDDFKTPNGFNLFLKKGAHFTDCYYDYANTHTAPGHATIGTGAYTDGHGIQSNQWWDFSRSTAHVYSSVDDDDYKLVGMPAGSAVSPGASPRNELASTLGDEVVLATKGEARSFGVSLKDRGSILPSGHASQGAFWIDHTSGNFITSTYWSKELPAWAAAFNAGDKREQARKDSGATGPDFYESVGGTPAGVRYTFEFAQALIEGEKMGKHPVTDVLTISVSSTDILGHAMGPDAEKQRALIDASDVEMNKFFTWLNTYVDGGLANVWVAITGDHGVAPEAQQANKLGMPANAYSAFAIINGLNDALTKKYSPGKPQKYVMLGAEIAYFALDERAFQAVHVNEEEAENAVAALLPEVVKGIAPAIADGKPASHLQVRRVFTKSQMARGDVPATDEGRRILHSYSPNGGWNILVEFNMYQIPGRPTGTTHYTDYSYDRHVPLGFYGSAFIPGTYHTRVAPVDIAATFASLLRVNQPTASIGRVVTEAIKPELDEAAPRRK